MITNASNIELAFILVFAVICPVLALLWLAISLRRRRRRRAVPASRSFLDVIGRSTSDRH